MPTKIVSLAVSTTGTVAGVKLILRSAMPAWIETPSVSTTAPAPMKASFVTLATLTATPTPTPVPPDLVVAPPSANAEASVRFCESRLRLAEPALCAVTLRPSGSIALALLLATVTATAPATLTLLLLLSPLSDVLALAPSVDAVLPVALESAVVALLSAAPCCAPTFLSTPSFCALLSLLPLPPATLALALAVLAETVVAAKLTLSPASMSRLVVASAVSVEMVRASEMPMPVSPDVVSPLASALTEPACEAVSETLPLLAIVVAAKLPSVASVSLFDTETAIDGVTAVLPALPAEAALLSLFFDEAESVMSLAPVMEASSPTCAIVSVMPILTPIAAPTPVAPPPSCLPAALVLLATKFSAFSNTLPLSVNVTWAPLPIVARLWLMPTLTASAPATPVSAPLEPAVASALKVSVWSSPILEVKACISRPSAVTCAPSSM